MGERTPAEILLFDAASGLIRTNRGSSDRHVEFLLQELDPAAHAFMRFMGETQTGDALGELLFLRLVAETSIRLAWIVDQGNASDRALRRRIDSLRKRDLVTLRDATWRLQLNTATIDEAIGRIDTQAAPRQVAQLAQARPLAVNSLAAYRWCSVLAHQGAGLRTVRRMPTEQNRWFLRDSMLNCVVLTSELLSVVSAQPASAEAIERLLAAAGEEFSAAAFALRIRHELRKERGPAGPVVLNVGLGISQSRNTTQVTIEAEVQVGAATRTLSGSGDDYEAAFAELLARVLALGDLDP